MRFGKGMNWMALAAGVLVLGVLPGGASAFTVFEGKVVFNRKVTFSDSITLKGSDWSLFPSAGFPLTVQLGPHQETLLAESFSSKGSKLVYKRPGVSGIRRLKVDMASGNFEIVAKGLYLWDLLNPFVVSASVGGVEQCSVLHFRVQSSRKWNFNSARGDIQSPGCGKVSGKISVPPTNLLEQEPNESPQEAQLIPGVGYSLAGYAASWEPRYQIRDPDHPFDWLELQDLFGLHVSGPSTVNLSIAADDLANNDLDLFLLDPSGTQVLGRSEGVVSMEGVQISTAGTYLIGVSAYKGASWYVLSVEPVAAAESVTSGGPIPPDAEFVPGEVLIKPRPNPKSGRKEDPVTLGQRHGLTHMRSLPPEVELFQLDAAFLERQKAKRLEKGKPAKDEGGLLKLLTLDMVRRLRLDPEVEYAEPNYIRRPCLVPNDVYFGYQWHYDLIGLPEAWDVTAGLDSVIVAVLDTGVLRLHPDLEGRLVEGYDFISSPSVANDGDGMDPDPEDPGDDPQGNSSSFHGTHVAGTIGASTNNATGVAGATWFGKIMPLRVLGVGGGTDADISQAIRYAAGLSNASQKLPAQRAHVINMSLGGPGYSQTLKDAITAARGSGVILIAAAGNDNSSLPFYPAAYQGVVAVSAVDASSHKAPYSNYGSWIDVAAPGGNLSADFNGDGFGDGVLSTLAAQSNRTITEYDYVFYQGTSMAAPHVAGVVALMLAVNPELRPDDLDSLLAGERPLAPGMRITRDLGPSGRDDLYGYGLIDALKAVAAAKAIAGSAGETGSILSLSADRINFDAYLTTLFLDVSNRGSGTLSVTKVSTDQPWIHVSPASGPTPLKLVVTVDRSGLAQGEYTARITIESDATQGDPVAVVEATMQVTSGALEGEIGTLYVLAVDPETYSTVAQAVTDSRSHYSFLTPFVPEGDYLVFAGTDRDDDGWICDSGEACGVYPVPVGVSAGSIAEHIDFVVANMLSVQSESRVVGEADRRGLRRMR